MDRNGFLPVTREEWEQNYGGQPDFVYVIGDAYVDHPSFGPAIISRVLESRGYTVAVISQPDWRKKESIRVFGEPRLAFLVSSGNMDSMVNHYTVSRKHRSRDAYTPGGVTGKRPDRAVIVYSNLIRQTYKKTPVILGGIEASLRRLAHYDYWSDSFRRSIRKTSMMRCIFRIMRACVLINGSMQKASASSMRIRILFPESAWRSGTGNSSMWYRILRQNLCHGWRWMISMPFPICAPAIP